MQWAPLNVTGGTIAPAPVQQQIYGNIGADGVYRWMGSLAVDRSGDMAFGYSAASGTTHLGVRYSGRLVTDPINTLAQGEATMAGGAFDQTGNCGAATCIRWGDYSAMSVDPIDNCTFWFTTEYYGSNNTNWLTRIGSFKFPSCVPTAAPVIISGRVIQPGGRGLADVTVRLQEGSNQRTTTTNSKGYYTFEQVTAGTFCVITVERKAYTFSPDNISFEAFADTNGDFSGTPVVRGPLSAPAKR